MDGFTSDLPASSGWYDVITPDYPGEINTWWLFVYTKDAFPEDEDYADGGFINWGWAEWDDPEFLIRVAEYRNDYLFRPAQEPEGSDQFDPAARFESQLQSEVMDYNPVPPKASYTINTIITSVERGKPSSGWDPANE